MKLFTPSTLNDSKPRAQYNQFNHVPPTGFIDTWIRPITNSPPTQNEYTENEMKDNSNKIRRQLLFLFQRHE